MTITGSNFGANATVNVYWGSADPANVIGTGSTDANGNLVAPITVTIPGPGSRIIVGDTKACYPISVAFTVQ